MSLGFYTSCTGCYESEDGRSTGGYPIHPKYGCYVGSGCEECNNRGIVYDWTQGEVDGVYESLIKSGDIIETIGDEK